MKIGVMSDSHGSLANSLKALDLLDDCDLIIHLGDVLYHGPRNDLPDDYNPKALAEILSEREDIIYVRGNCDSDVDEMVIKRDLSKDHRIIDLGKYRLYLVHGYKEDEEQRLKKAKANKVDIIATGHTHIKDLRFVDGIVLLNPGSTSIAKDVTKSVAKIYDDRIDLINLSDESLIKTLDL
ncbi:MAG: phosphodiesterase [Finegoldia sp.]|nr:phosphodiesterase [Finegoldia sp.]